MGGAATRAAGTGAAATGAAATGAVAGVAAAAGGPAVTLLFTNGPARTLGAALGSTLTLELAELSALSRVMIVAPGGLLKVCLSAKALVGNGAGLAQAAGLAPAEWYLNSDGSLCIFLATTQAGDVVVPSGLRSFFARMQSENARCGPRGSASLAVSFLVVNAAATTGFEVMPVGQPEFAELNAALRKLAVALGSLPPPAASGQCGINDLLAQLMRAAWDPPPQPPPV
jgi:hypothetical protein